MKIGSINTYQNFKANNDKKNSKSFMGRVSEGVSNAFDEMTVALNSATKATNDISDIISSTKNVFSSPEEATINVLTDQIDDKVVNNEKAPNWLRKTASYGSALLAAGGTFIMVRKTPGVIKDFVVNNLSKFELGSKILNKLAVGKRAVVGFISAIGTNRVKNGLKYVNNYLAEKLPKSYKIVKNTINKVKLDKIKNWTMGDYTKNIIATVLGYQTGEKVLNKHQDVLKPDKSSKTNEDVSLIDEAA